MGPSNPEFPAATPVRPDVEELEAIFVQRPVADYYISALPADRPAEPRLRYVVLFLLTLASATFVGINHYASFRLGFSSDTLDLDFASLLLRGFWYSAPMLLILGAHEFGHYFACRYYGINASLPYFIPAPILLTGTLGAVIRIRELIPAKRALFDIGIAGPIAGFLTLLPFLALGMAMSRVVPLPPADFQGSIIEFGEPLLFQLASWLTFGPVPAGYTVNMHPIVFACWFGMMATALNLFPIGQLDGGHITYALFGRRSSLITFLTIGVLVVMTAIRPWSWGVWTTLMLVMLFMFGPNHPRVFDEDVPLDGRRRALALFALIMFVACFTPVPISFPEGTGSDLFAGR